MAVTIDLDLVSIWPTFSSSKRDIRDETPQTRVHSTYSMSEMPAKRSGPADLFPVIYGELRRVADRYLSRERRNHTLQPTALVHEAWLKLQNERSVQLHGRTHGLALAAQAMRRLLVDHGRHQKRDKRGGGAQALAIDDVMKAAETAPVPLEDLLTIEAALTRLEAEDPRAAQVV